MQELVAFQKDLGLTLGTSREPEMLFKHVVAAVARTVHADGSTLFLFTSAHKQGYCAGHIGFSTTFIIHVTSFLDSPRGREMLLRGTPHYGSAQEILEPDRTGISEHERIAFLPIIQKERLLGILIVAFGDSAPIPAETRNVLEAVAFQIGTALILLDAEEELRLKEERFRVLADQSLFGLTTVDQEGTILYANPKFSEILGYTIADLPDEDRLFRALFPLPATRQGALEAWSSDKASLATGEKVNRIFDVVAKDGTGKRISFTLARLNENEFSLVYEDVTERFAAEQALKRSEERYRDLVENAPVGIYVTTVQGDILYANRALAVMYGYSSVKEMMASNSTRHYRNPEERNAFLNQLRQGGAGRAFEVKRLTRDGETRYSLVTGIFRGDTISGMIVDITEQVEAHQTLKAQSGSLEEMNTALRVLLKQRDSDRAMVEESLRRNVRDLVFPYLEKLKNQNGVVARTMAEIIETNLKDILTPFLHTITTRYTHLTPREIEIADLIRKGKTTKEIAELLAMSPRTIDIHRLNLRKKLAIQNTKVSLKTFLLSIS